LVASNAAPVTRRSFSRLKNPADLPHLIDIQRRSFEGLVDPKKGLLRATIDDISPTEDYTGNLAIVFGDFTFDDPPNSVDECREKDMTYSRPLNVKVAFQNRETGEIREQTVFMGDFPWMTDRGTFIINGTERVVVTQLVRSPGAYIMEPKDREKQVFIANLMPARGSWLELAASTSASTASGSFRSPSCCARWDTSRTSSCSTSSTTRSTSGRRSPPTPIRRRATRAP
jgi:DNA-directed RNA polymerase subunit beta